MALTTNFNVSPYYDDYTDSKNFLRVLFRPGYAVQARELTQLQTILQKQTERIGNHLFRNGTKIYGGDFAINVLAKSVKIETSYSGSEVTMTNFNGKQIKGITSGATGIVFSAIDLSSTDPKTIVYIPTNTNNFSDGEVIQTIETVPSYATAVSASGTSGIANAVSNASVASISEGIFFVDGFFVSCDSQNLVIEKYTNTPSTRIGLSITESLLTSTDDSSILDNAQGSFNFAAPGADRFKISLTLAKKDITSSSTSQLADAAEEKFITLSTLDGGERIDALVPSIYSHLGDAIARRTFEESGNYTVKSFGLQVLEHTSNTELLSALLEPGKGYVKGYRYETIVPTSVDVEKGRSSQNNDSITIESNYGNELIIKNMKGDFDFDEHKIIDLHCVVSSSINAITSDSKAQTYYESTKIGTARIRSLDWYKTDTTSTVSTNHSKYAAKLYDVQTKNVLTGTFNGRSDVLNLGVLDPDTSPVSGAYIGATITVNTTLDSTTTSDVVTIEDYVVSGTTHTATFNKNLSQKILSNSTYTISFDFKDVDGISIVHADDQKTNPSNSSFIVKTAFADVSEESKIGSDLSGDTILLKTDNNNLLFQLPESPVKAIANGVTYTFKRTIQASSFANGNFNLSVSGLGSGYSFPLGAGTYTGDTANKNFIVVVKDATSVTDINGENVANGDIIDFSADLGRSVVIDGVGGAQVIANTVGSYTADVIFKVKIENSIPKTKSIVAANVSTIQTYTDINKGQIHIDNPSKQPLGKNSLMVADCFNLVKVVDSLDPTSRVLQADITNAAKDVTNNYVLDTGQRDNFYDYSSVSLKPDASPPLGQILVFVDRFTTTGTDAGYFSLESYRGSFACSYNLTTPISFGYDKIPNYTSPVTGRFLNLRDVVDFRPRRKDANNGGGSANTSDDMTSNTSTFEFTTPVLVGTPNTSDNLVLDNLEFYLSRIDKVVLTKDGEFKTIKGIAAEVPVTPPDDEDSMTLYILSIPAYTFSPSNVTVKYIDNRRYTMRDIGKLERRIERLEYYTALSLLEKETVNSKITDDVTVDTVFNPVGERFKNGILVDSFSGHSVGDVTITDYSNSIDLDGGLMRPGFTARSRNMKYISANSTNVQKTGNLVTLSYTSNNFVRQPLQSSFIKPNEFNFPDFGIGKGFLFPQTDVWYDTSARPDVLVNSENQNDHWAFSENNNGHGLQWNDWSEIWSGKQINPDPYVNVNQKDVTGASRFTSLAESSKTRVGIKTDKIPEAIIENVGNKTVDLSVVPYIRTQTVYFSYNKLIPNSNVYPYFDDVSYQEYTTPSYNLSLTSVNSASSFIIGEEITNGSNTAIILGHSITSSNVAVVQYHVTYSTGGDSNTAFSSGTITSERSLLSATIDASTPYAANSALKTNIHGEVSGKFTIQASTHKVGERNFRITSSSNNSMINLLSAADSVFVSKGLIETRTESHVSTRPLEVNKLEPTSNKVYQTSVNNTRPVLKWINPLAQIFSINEGTHPNGIFVSSLTLFFRQRPTIVDSTSPRFPVSVEIRPMVENLPSSSDIIPLSFSSKIVDAITAVGTTTTPDIANTSHQTVFTFQGPVYLPPNEYALVIKTTSSDYELFTGEAGQNHAGTVRRIVRPPNVGQMFLPTNKAEWEPVPDEFLMFQLNKCTFDTSTTGVLTVKNDKEDLNGNTSNVHFHEFKINSNILNFKQTSVNTQFKASNTSGSFDSTFTDFSLDQNIKLSEEKFIEYDTGTTTFNQDFEIKTSLSSTDENISPVIDLERYNLTTIKNNINNAQLSNDNIVIVSGGSGYSSAVQTAGNVQGGGGSGAVIEFGIDGSGTITSAGFTSGGTGYVTTPTIFVPTNVGGSGAEIVVRGETDAKGGNIDAKYITRNVTLADGFDSKDLKVILNAYKPQGSDIKIYAKVISAEDTDTFDEKGFILLEQETESTVYSLNEFDYKDFVFKTTEDSISYISNNSLFTKFKTFSIKIALLSTSGVIIPKIRDMRAIALDE